MVNYLSGILGGHKGTKDAANKRVERSLYERANGYSYDAVRFSCLLVAKEPVIVHYTEHCPPDVGAAFIWLKNRDPDHWRDVQNVEHVLGKYIISDRPMTVEQWAAERATVVQRGRRGTRHGYGIPIMVVR